MLCSVPMEGDAGAHPAAQGDAAVEPAPLAQSCRKSTEKWCGGKAMQGSEDVSPLTEPTGVIPSGMQSPAQPQKIPSLCSISTPLNGVSRGGPCISAN